MENNKAQLVLKSLRGEDITFDIETHISQWHEEQIQSIYFKFMTYDEKTKKSELDTNNPEISKLIFGRQTKLIEILVTAWHGTDLPLTTDNIKKSFSSEEYDKLVAKVEEIYNSQTLSEEKKSPLPETSS